MKIIFTFIFIAGLIGYFFFERIVNLDEEFTLKKNEAAKIEKTNLSLKMLGNGHTTLINGGHTFICKFEVKFIGRTEEKALEVGKSLVVENLRIKLQGIDETADPKEKDPWSSTSCKFIVTKNAG